jgi:hypothetical protein
MLQVTSPLRLDAAAKRTATLEYEQDGKGSDSETAAKPL